MLNTSSSLSRTQLGRMLQLILLLRAGRFPNASVLAETCEVSRRTIYRDLQTLESGGVPVRFRGDQGGYEIAPGFFFEAQQLEESEAIALVIQALRPGSNSGPCRSDLAYSAVQKIAQSLPEAFRDRILTLVEGLRESPDAMSFDIDRAHLHEVLVSSLAMRHTVRIWFENPDSGGLIATKVSPVRLTLHGNAWQLVGRSTVHRRIETIRVSWMVRVEETGEESLETRSAAIDRVASSARIRARLRFDARMAPEILDSHWPRACELESLDDGGVQMSLVVDDLDVLTAWILSLGEQVEVLGPVSLRDRIRETARRVVRLNASAPGTDSWDLRSGQLRDG